MRSLMGAAGCWRTSVALQAWWEPWGIARYGTDPWGASARHLDADVQHPGQRQTQHIEHTHRTLRTRSKRLVHTTMGFSPSTAMHNNQWC